MPSDFRYKEKPTRSSSSRWLSSPLTKALIVLCLIALFLWRLNTGRDGFLRVPEYSSSLLNKVRPHGHRIAIITFVTSQHSYMYISLKNKFHYAELHGYDLIVDYETNDPRGTIWHKFNMIERVVQGGQHDWIWWMDFDTLITNTSIPLTDVIEESLANSTVPANNVDFLLTEDCNRLNAGSMIVRSSQRSIDFLNKARQIHDESKAAGNDIHEQESMLRLLKSDDPLANHAVFIPQWKINAFPEEIGCYDEEKRKWERGMLAIHFAGAWAHLKMEDPTGWLMLQYERQIIWGKI